MTRFTREVNRSNANFERYRYIATEGIPMLRISFINIHISSSFFFSMCQNVNFTVLHTHEMNTDHYADLWFLICIKNAEYESLNERVYYLHGAFSSYRCTFLSVASLSAPLPWSALSPPPGQSTRLLSKKKNSKCLVDLIQNGENIRGSVHHKCAISDEQII